MIGDGGKDGGVPEEAREECKRWAMASGHFCMESFGSGMFGDRTE